MMLSKTHALCLRNDAPKCVGGLAPCSLWWCCPYYNAQCCWQWTARGTAFFISPPPPPPPPPPGGQEKGLVPSPLKSHVHMFYFIGLRRPNPQELPSAAAIPRV